MILGLGTDIVENDRIELIYKKYGRHFLNRIYTQEEIDYCLKHENPTPYLAARFAVKEAAVKALNIQERIGLLYRDIEVAGSVFGKKKLRLNGKAEIIAENLGVKYHHLSLTHTEQISMAVVIFEG
ncbi:MAG: holo-ACP synthase [Leptonema sp. (in: Bacteria)]|nr:holo-ACP synthase [Leptonema sp. (in: bacteria)]